MVTSPDGWVLTVAAKDETQLPVAPLTTAVSSREYLVGGTFTGTVTGSGKTSLNGGVLEAGYQIGCGIELGQVRLIGQVGSTRRPTRSPPAWSRPGCSFPLSGTIEIHPKPGTVSTVTVDKKSFKAAPGARHAQGHPHQGRRLRRPVVPPFLRDADQFDHRHRRRRRLLRRHQGSLTSRMGSNRCSRLTSRRDSDDDLGLGVLVRPGRMRR